MRPRQLIANGALQTPGADADVAALQLGSDFWAFGGG